MRAERSALDDAVVSLQLRLRLRVASPITVTELVDVAVCLISWGADPIFCLAQYRQRLMDFWSR